MKHHYPKIFKTSDNPLTMNDSPVYLLRDGKLYRTTFHPGGWSEHPDYEMKNDGKLYRTEHHSLGSGKGSDYKFGGDKKIYRTRCHPDGAPDTADFEIRD